MCTIAAVATHCAADHLIQVGRLTLPILGAGPVGPHPLHHWCLWLIGEAGGRSAAGLTLPCPPHSPPAVESVISAPAKLYVRHTLPLEQARAAMILNSSPAAIVVDDAFCPMGVVYLVDVETELAQRKILMAPDDN